MIHKAHSITFSNSQNTTSIPLWWQMIHKVYFRPRTKDPLAYIFFYANLILRFTRSDKNTAIMTVKSIMIRLITHTTDIFFFFQFFSFHLLLLSVPFFSAKKKNSFLIVLILCSEVFLIFSIMMMISVIQDKIPNDVH